MSYIFYNSEPKFKQSNININNLSRFQHKISAVYFLFHKGVVVYVGESQNIYRRLLTHKKSKRFDEFNYMVGVEDKYGFLNSVEYEYITKLKPQYNINCTNTEWNTEEYLRKLETNIKAISLKQQLGVSVYYKLLKRYKKQFKLKTLKDMVFYLETHLKYNCFCITGFIKEKTF